MTDLVRDLQQTLATYSGVSRWWIGFSGGLDSTVLAASMAALKRPEPVHCVYINHGLSAHAQAWQQHCAAMCAQWGLVFTAIDVTVVPAGEGIEAAARAARYQAFAELLQEGDGLLLGHHLDDQAETLLLRLMRGAGVDGLGGIRPQRRLAQARIFRPLLSYTRQQLEVQAKSMKLQWIEDDSNTDLQFDRNYLRHAVMPALKERWPNVQRQWQRSMDLCNQTSELLFELAKEDLERAEPKQEVLGQSLDLPALRRLSRARRANLLRYWLLQAEQGVPEQAHLEQLEIQLVGGREDAQPQVGWGNVLLRRFQDRLYWLPAVAQAPSEAIHWNGQTPLRWGDWLLTLEPVPSGGWSLPPEGVLIRTRIAGERCQPSWRQRSQTLKKLLQETGVEPWLREQLPMVTSTAGELIAVADLWSCQGWQADSDQGVELKWCYQPQAFYGYS